MFLLSASGSRSYWMYARLTCAPSVLISGGSSPPRPRAVSLCRRECRPLVQQRRIEHGQSPGFGLVATVTVQVLRFRCQWQHRSLSHAVTYPLCVMPGAARFRTARHVTDHETFTGRVFRPCAEQSHHQRQKPDQPDQRQRTRRGRKRRRPGPVPIGGRRTSVSAGGGVTTSAS